MKVRTKVVAMVLMGTALVWLALALWCPSLAQAKNMFRLQGAEMCSDFGMPRMCALENDPYRTVLVAKHDRCYTPICYQLASLFPKDPIVGGLLSTMIFASAFLLSMVLLGETSSPTGSRAEAWLMAGAMMTSAPFIFNLERANPIWIPVAGIMLFLAWHEAKSAWKRGLALLALAIAIAFKLTPGVFALLLVEDRRWRELVVLSALATAMIFVPFAFCGGLTAVGEWRDCVRAHLEHYGSFKPIGLFISARVVGAKVFGGGSVGFDAMMAIGRFADVVCGLAALLTFFRTRDRQLEALMLVMTMLFLPASAQYYTLLYLAPVLALSVSRKLPVAEAVLLVLALCALRLPVTKGEVNLSYLLVDIALFGLLVMGGKRVWTRG